MTTQNATEQAMRDAVTMAGGKIDREEFFVKVQELRALDGVTASMDSLRTNTMKKFRLDNAGITRVQIPSLDIDELWTTELAQAAADGIGTGASSASFGGDANAGSYTADYGTAQDVWFGIERASTDDYPELEGSLVQETGTGYMEQNGELFKMAVALQENMHMMTEGPTGCGKTMAFKQLSFETGRFLARVNCRDGIDWEDLVGYPTADANGGTQFIDGMLTRAVRHGGIFYADEFNYARPAVMGGLNMVMDSRVLEIPFTGEVIKAHPNFTVVASFNPGYAGTNEINGATRSRFGMNLVFDYLSADLETEVIQSQSGVALPDVAAELVSFANRVRDLKTSHTVETDLSTRDLVGVMTLLKHFDIKTALEMSVIAMFDGDEREEVRTVANHALSNYA